MSTGVRQSMRKKSQARRRREKLKEVAHESARGAEWFVLFFGLLVALVGVLVSALKGEVVFAVLFFLFSLFVGAALWKRQAE
jgi:membrane protein YqaA with SNARE-associated domain